MIARLLRLLLRALYGLAVFSVFVLAAYFSFNGFVRSGVTTVPEIVGRSRGEATARLTEQGLRLRRVNEKGRYDEKVPAGMVLRQSPDAHTLVKRGSGVDLILSLGPRRIEVPQLADQAFPAAQSILSGVGLGVGQVLSAFAERRPAGSVVAQDPPAGSLAAPTVRVDLLLALPGSGERYVMPDLIYRHYEQIRPYFESQSFRLGSVKYERYEGVAAGVILRQFPLPGHPLTRNDPVSLVVATAEGLTG